MLVLNGAIPVLNDPLNESVQFWPKKSLGCYFCRSATFHLIWTFSRVWRGEASITFLQFLLSCIIGIPKKTACGLKSQFRGPKIEVTRGVWSHISSLVSDWDSKKDCVCGLKSQFRGPKIEVTRGVWSHISSLVCDWGSSSRIDSKKAVFALLK